MATITSLLNSVESRRCFVRELNHLFYIGFAMPRRRALRLARALAAGNGAGMIAFFRDVLGWTRDPTVDEQQAARVVLVRGRRWRDPTEIGAADVAAYLSRAITRRMHFDGKERRAKARHEARTHVRFIDGRPIKRGGQPARSARLRQRVVILQGVPTLPGRQRQLLRRLAEGETPAHALGAMGEKWALYQALMRRARRIEAATVQPTRALQPRLVRRCS